MTISRYFNDPDSVALKTREKIQKAIEDTGFIPTRVPTIMSSSSSHTLGLVIPSFSNGVFSEVIDAVDESCRKAGYGLLLMHSSYDPKIEEDQVASLLSYQVDSIILCDTVHTELTRKRLEKSGIPVAELLSLADQPLGINMGIDYEQIFYKVTKILIECGRKHPAYFGVRMDPRTLIRRNGYLQAVKEAGLQELSFSSSNRSNFALGRDMMLNALKEHPDLDAVLCTNDDVGVGALIACQALNIKVPEQVAVIGCNGLKFCDAAMPKLCSIKTPRYELAQEAVAEILKQLESGKRSEKVKKASCSLLKGGSATEEEQKKLGSLFSAVIDQ
ncbi:MAG: LacI family DNA-binding transcriptional regulator [Succinatimonas sp.]|nr:LacI family DNA-binding transcriptional regulator [Succinatimonas sp.]